LIMQARNSVETGARPDDGDLVARLADSGDDDAFGELYRMHAPNIRAFLERFVDSHTAEDLTQDTFVRAYRRRLDFEDRGISFNRLLYRIARNTHIDHCRRKSTRSEHVTAELPPVASFEEGVEEKVMGSMAVEKVLGAMEGLNPDIKGTAIAIVVEGQDRNTHMQAVGIREGTVKSRVSRAMGHLRSQLQPEDIV
jgi:RNA polymerase sigma factor (sigma-70 family)